MGNPQRDTFFPHSLHKAGERRLKVKSNLRTLKSFPSPLWAMYSSSGKYWQNRFLLKKQEKGVKGLVFLWTLALHNHIA